MTIPLSFFNFVFNVHKSFVIPLFASMVFTIGILLPKLADASPPPDPPPIYYKLNEGTLENGGAVHDPSSSPVLANSLVEFTATADPGYHFHEWIGHVKDQVSNSQEVKDNPVEIEVTKDTDYDAKFDENTITKIQYKDSDDTWQDLSESSSTPLVVFEGDTVEFRGVANYGNGFAKGKPDWSGTCEAGGSGEEISVTFREASEDTSDIKTLIAKALNIRTGYVYVTPSFEPEEEEPPYKPGCDESTPAGATPLNSYIDNRSGVFNEDFSVAGTGLQLYYMSNRVPVWNDGYSIDIFVPGASASTSPATIWISTEVTLTIAGRAIVRTFSQPNGGSGFTWTYKWDGLDSNGDVKYGPLTATVDIEHTPKYRHATTDILTNGTPITVSTSTIDIEHHPATNHVALGWSLGGHHHMRLSDKTRVYKGDGSVASNDSSTTTTFNDSNGLSYVFDGTDGRHLTTKHSDTGTTLLTFSYTDYSGTNLLTEIEDMFGNEITLQRDLYGKLTSITSVDDIVTTVTIDSENDLTKVSYDDPESTTGGTIDYTVVYADDGTDSIHLIDSVTDPESRVSSYVYDFDGRVIEATDGDGGEWFWVRSKGNNNSSVERTAFVTHDATPVVKKMTIADTYTAEGDRTTTTTMPNGEDFVSRVVKNGSSDTVESENPCGTDSDITYGTDSEYGYRMTTSVTTTLPSAGLDVTVDYARTYGTNTITNTSTVDGKTNTVVHDTSLDKVTYTSPEGRSAYSIYDDTTLQTEKVVIPEQYDTHYDYDTQGRLIAVSQGPDGDGSNTNDPFSVTTANRIVRVTYVASGDGKGNINTIEINNDSSTEVDYDYDSLGRLTSVTRADGEVISADLSKMGDVESLKLPTDTTATKDHDYTYDRRHTTDTYTTPKGYVYSADYNDDGSLKSSTSPTNTTTVNQDAGTAGYLDDAETEAATFIKGVLDNIDLPGSEGKISFTYTTNNKPNVISLDRNEDGTAEETVTFAYNGSVPTSVTFGGTLSQTLSTTYNDDDLSVNSATYAGVTKNFTYDDDGLLLTAGTFTINRGDDPLTTGVREYNTTGRVDYVTDGTFTVTPTYTNFAEVNALDYEISSTSKADWLLTLNDFGEITAKDDTVNGTTREYDYTYDDLGQLLTVKLGGTTVEAYTYDENGNRKTSTVSGVARTYTYDDDDRLLGWDGPDAGTAYDVSYAYDNSGFLTTRTEGSDVTTYDYSSSGELLKVELPNGDDIEYVHGVGGERLAKKVNGTITEKYLWSGINLLAIYNSSNTLVTRFEKGGMTHNGTHYYFTYDQVGSLRAIYNTSGVLQGEITYDSFGNELSNSLTGTLADIPLGFAGGYTDRDTGLVRFGFRDYDPDVGRWTAKDPIGFAGGDTDLYRYCYNNPVMYNDPVV